MKNNTPLEKLYYLLLLLLLLLLLMMMMLMMLLMMMMTEGYERESKDAEISTSYQTVAWWQWLLPDRYA